MSESRRHTGADQPTVLHGPWRDESGLSWRVVETAVGPQVQAQTGVRNTWEFIDDRQPCGAVSRRLAVEMVRVAGQPAAPEAAAECDRLREQLSIVSQAVDARVLEVNRERGRVARLREVNAELLTACEAAKIALLTGQPQIVGDTTVYPLDGPLVGNALNKLRAAIASAKALTAAAPAERCLCHEPCGSEMAKPKPCPVHPVPAEEGA